MGFYAQKTQKLWGDVSLHEALNGQVGGDLAGHLRGRGRSEHQDWKAGDHIKRLVNNIRSAAISGRGTPDPARSCLACCRAPRAAHGLLRCACRGDRLPARGACPRAHRGK